MTKLRIAILFLLAVVALPATAYPSSTRSIQADQLVSSDQTKTYSLPAVTGTVMLSVGIVQETPSGTVNGSNTAFTLANTPAVSATVRCFLDGLSLTQGGGNDYTISGASITMASAPALGQTLYCSYSKY